MCDYSLQNVKTRDAAVDDKLIVRGFGTGTTGFADISEKDVAVGATAVCLLPGTELAFDEPIARIHYHCIYAPDNSFNKDDHKVARFRQIDKDAEYMHHDALELPNGELTVLNRLTVGQTATVIQLPAKPKTQAEAEEQKRVPVKA